MMNTYDCNEWQTEQSDNSHFRLHSHDEYEIFMFIEGDSRYIVEDKVYTLEPGDVLIIRKHEMHRIFHNSQTKYDRFVIMVSPQFFIEKNCIEYEEAFLENMKHKGNKIDSRTVYSSGLYDAIMRLKKYSHDFTCCYSPVTDSVIVEILYIINKTVSFSNPDLKNSQVMNVISYINSNYTQEISLDSLAEKFFISKYHLCRIFREATGHTIHSYIRSKRLIYASELIKNGKNMTEAAMLSGFKNYSSFYRAYHSEKSVKTYVK